MSEYSNVTVTLNSDPSVVADVDGSDFTHGDEIRFTVPEAGIYTVTIEDGVSCAGSFTVDMSGCQEVVFDVAEEFANPGTVICVPVTVSNFVDVASFQYSISWDPDILELESVSPTTVFTISLNLAVMFSKELLLKKWANSNPSLDSSKSKGLCFSLILS